MFNKPPLTLPQLGLLLLCAAWLLPGLVGHAPWKGGDSDQFVQLLRHGDNMSLAASPLYGWAVTATAWLTAPFLAPHDGARLASGLFVALALVFVARAARTLYGGDAGWAAVLTLLGCVGLLVRGHEINAETAQFAAAAAMLYGLASLPHRARGGWLLGAGAVSMLLAGAAVEGLLILLLSGLLGWLSPEFRTPAARRALAIGVMIALAGSALWVTYLSAQGVSFARAFDLQRWAGETGLRPAYYPSILGWYAWPAWPLAAWALYRGRRHWRTPGIVLPAIVLLGLLGLYAFDAYPAEQQGFILLLPLALLGGAGLFSLRRGAANALLWFAVMLFGFIGLLFWVAWSAHDLGMPTRLAARLTRIGMGDVGELRPWALVLGLIVSMAWIGFLVRLQRSPLRPMLVWTAGMTFIWCLLLALFQAPLDRRLSYVSVADELVARVPPTACIQARKVRSQQRQLLAYHSGRRLVANGRQCDWLLVETGRRGAEPDVSADWVKQWEGARPGDRFDRFHLYARR